MPAFAAILSPAKSLEMDAGDLPEGLVTSKPRFTAQTREIAEALGVLMGERLSAAGRGRAATRSSPRRAALLCGVHAERH